MQIWFLLHKLQALAFFLKMQDAPETGEYMEVEALSQLVQLCLLKKATVVPINPLCIQNGFILRIDLIDGHRQFIKIPGTAEPMLFTSLNEIFDFCQKNGLDWFGVEIKPKVPCA